MMNKLTTVKSRIVNKYFVIFILILEKVQLLRNPVENIKNAAPESK